MSTFIDRVDPELLPGLAYSQDFPPPTTIEELLAFRELSCAPAPKTVTTTTPAAVATYTASGVSLLIHAAAPRLLDRAGKRVRIGELAAARPIGADEIGVAKAADGVGPVALAATPQIATGEAAKDSGPTGLGAFALQCLEDLFDSVTHDDAAIGSSNGAGGALRLRRRLAFTRLIR